jgi:hypothetical protein
MDHERALYRTLYTKPMENGSNGNGIVEWMVLISQRETALQRRDFMFRSAFDVLLRKKDKW